MPPPQKFARPKSGGGRKVKIRLPNHPASNRGKKGAQGTSSSDEPDDEGGETDQEETNSEKEIQMFKTMYKHQPRKKNFFRKSHQRGYDPGYAQVKVSLDIYQTFHLSHNEKTALRLRMNKLLGISKNDDIVRIDLATHEEVQDYETGNGAEPSLDPMRPYLEGKLLVEWNNRLCEMFVEHLAEKEQWDLTEEVRCTLEMAFENRLSTLQKNFRRFAGKSEEQAGEMK